MIIDNDKCDCLIIYFFFSKLINGLTPQDDPYYKDNGLVVNDVIFGNLFDGDMAYNMMGFMDSITVCY